jgi:hypothetical protein
LRDLSLRGEVLSEHLLVPDADRGVAIDPKKLLPPDGPRSFLPRRWVVERTFSWLGQNRRMSKDYERLCETSEAFVYAPMSRLMVRRLARS